MNAIQLIRAIIGSFLINILPGYFFKGSKYSGKVAFVVNVPSWDLVNAPYKNLIRKIFPKLFPLVVSGFEGFLDKNNVSVSGCVILCPLTAYQILKNPKLANKKVLKSVKIAEKLGAKIASLGAFTSIAVHDGFDIVDKVKISITTGNAFSALIEIKNAQQAAQKIGLEFSKSTVAIIGAAGSVGSGCAKYLIGNVERLILVDINISELNRLFQNEAENITKIYKTQSLCSIKEADIIIVVTSAVNGIVESDMVKSGAIIIDGAYPPNVSNDIIASRNDIIVISSAIAKVKNYKCDFDFGLGKEEVYGCLGEALLLMWMGREGDYALGKVDESMIREMENAGDKAGVRVADFRNPLGYISEKQFEYIKNIREVLSRGKL